MVPEGRVDYESRQADDCPEEYAFQPGVILRNRVPDAADEVVAEAPHYACFNNFQGVAHVGITQKRNRNGPLLPYQLIFIPRPIVVERKALPVVLKEKLWERFEKQVRHLLVLAVQVELVLQLD